MTNFTHPILHTANCLRVFNFNEIIQNFIEILYLSIAHAFGEPNT